MKLTLTSPSAFTVVVAFTACTNTSDGPFVGRVSRSEFFEYHDKATTPLCDSLLPLLDEHARRIGGLIGYEPSGDSPIRYYKFSSVADFAENQDDCAPSPGACARGNSVYSWQPLHAHELAHDYTFRAWGGWSNGLLDEGEATALSCEPAFEQGGWVGPPPDWRGLLGLRENAVRYIFAGSFITYLASNFGWPSVGELHRRIPPAATPLDFEREFARVYPMSVDEAWSAAQSSPGIACFPDWLCMATPLVEGETLDDRDCDGEWHRSILIESQPAIVLSFTGEGLTLTNCAEPGPSLMLDGSLEAGRRSVHWTSLPPGNYAINDFIFPAPSSVSLERYLSRPLLGETCDVAGTVDLDATAQTFIDLPPRLATGWIQIHGGGRAYLLDSPFGITTAGAALEICESCGADQVCTPVLSSRSAPVVVPDQAALHLRNVVSSPWTQLKFVPVAP